MQFWIIKEDAKENAKALPLMALKTNAREGWQILSDIGHIHGVTWEGQNKAYSLSHVCTRSHCVNLAKFDMFLKHYAYCIAELNNRTGKVSSFTWKYNFLLGNACKSLYWAIPVDRTPEQFMTEYLMTKKYNRSGKQQISDDEIKTLKELIND